MELDTVISSATLYLQAMILTDEQIRNDDDT
jgi:hypothetical protein